MLAAFTLFAWNTVKDIISSILQCIRSSLSGGRISSHIALHIKIGFYGYKCYAYRHNLT